MSQPPPPYQPGPYPGAPYPGAPYPGAVGPPPSNDGAKIALIIIAVIVAVVLLFCGGIFAAVFYAVKSVDEAIGEFDGDRRGGRDNPIVVSEGEAFTIDGFDYAEGWRVDAGDGRYGENAIVGLQVVNDRSDEDTRAVSIDFTLLAGSAEVAEISCYSDGVISHGRSETLNCSAASASPGEWDAIEVSASY